MNKKKKGKIFHNSSIRYTIFTYFTVTALAASLLITFSIYQRLASQVSETVMEENQSLIGQVARSVENYLRTVMKLSDSLYYGAVKNADLSSESINSEITLLYDNNKDNVDNIALFSQDGTLKEAVPAARIKTNLDVTGDSWFSNALEKTEKPVPLGDLPVTGCGADGRNLDGPGRAAGGSKLLQPGASV